MCFVFYRTSDVFAGEEVLNKKNILVEVVPTPVQDKAYCGVCLRVPDTVTDAAEVALQHLEFKKIV